MGIAQMWKLIADMCVAWQASDAQRESTIAKLVAQADEHLSVTRQVEGDFRIIDGKLREAEAHIASLEKTNKFQDAEITAFKKMLDDSQRADPERLRFLETEVAALREQLKDAFMKGSTSPPPASRAKKHAQSTPPRMPRPSAEEHRNTIAEKVAAMEAGPLKLCAEADRPALRKKLLLKWHPDKQPSPEHAEMAKQVMQELQNTPIWNC